jgi:hypothetical protein
MTASFSVAILPPLLIASTAVNQIYNIDASTGTKKYIVPSFTTNPSGYEAFIIYSDVSTGSPASVSFDPTSREYDWSSVLLSPVTFTLSMQGDCAGSTSVQVSFTVTISKAAVVTPQSVYKITPNTGPPYFSPVLSNITVSLLKTKVFTFPKIMDPDKNDQTSFVSLKLGGSSS